MEITQPEAGWDNQEVIRDVTKQLNKLALYYQLFFLDHLTCYHLRQYPITRWNPDSTPVMSNPHQHMSIPQQHMTAARQHMSTGQQPVQDINDHPMQDVHQQTPNAQQAPAEPQLPAESI